MRTLPIGEESCQCSLGTKQGGRRLKNPLNIICTPQPQQQQHYWIRLDGKPCTKVSTPHQTIFQCCIWRCDRLKKGHPNLQPCQHFHPNKAFFAAQSGAWCPKGGNPRWVDVEALWCAARCMPQGCPTMTFCFKSQKFNQNPKGWIKWIISLCLSPLLLMVSVKCCISGTCSDFSWWGF